MQNYPIHDNQARKIHLQALQVEGVRILEFKGHADGFADKSFNVTQKSQRTQKYFLEHEFNKSHEFFNFTQKSAVKANLGAANTEPSLLELC